MGLAGGKIEMVRSWQLRDDQTALVPYIDPANLPDLQL